jgi:NADPH-dependent 2,4-dienoyl-CoA reductase/sulfur reductase-like enzyme
VPESRLREREAVPYDKLVIATGSTPRIPRPRNGTVRDNHAPVHAGADYLRRIRDERKIRKAVIIGGGLIGIETAEALELAGMEITVVELLPQLLTFLDWEMAKLVENHVRSKNANVITQKRSRRLPGESGKLTAVKLTKRQRSFPASSPSWR